MTADKQLERLPYFHWLNIASVVKHYSYRLMPECCLNRPYFILHNFCELDLTVIALYRNFDFKSKEDCQCSVASFGEFSLQNHRAQMQLFVGHGLSLLLLYLLRYLTGITL